jgi:spoIIIJ-associated protein
MSKTIISEGKTTAEAINKGLEELKINKEEAEIKILEEKKKSFFSILDPHVVRVEITAKDRINQVEQTKKEIPQEVIKEEEEEIEKFLKEFLSKISNNISYKIKKDEESIFIEIIGEDATKLIGYRGETLNALQLILSNISNKKAEDSARIILDIAGYREKRKETLEELASKIEKTVTRTGKKVTLEPMTPYERKIIHTKLQDSEYVKTYSIGENNNRRVVIAKK